MTGKMHFLNGKFISEDELVVSARDVGFSRGYAVFDFLITYSHHRPFKLSRHIDRLFNSAHYIGLKTPWSKEQVSQWVLETLEKNESEAEKSIKIIISGGVSDTMLPAEKPTLVIIVDPKHEYPKENYENGTGVIAVKHHRYTPGAKSNNYMEGMKQTQIAKEIGAAEPIYYNETQVFEGSNSNIFAVIDNKLVTPKTNILYGITRETLLEILKLDMPIEERDFTLDELLSASEVFLTGSGKEISPVTKIDGNEVGNGEVGRITKEVMNQFRKYTSSV
jgi:branched-chain amino acid aminotransferase